MGTGTLTDRADGDIIDSSWWNDIHLATKGDWVPRNSAGAAQNLAGSLGTLVLWWDKLYINDIVYQGESINFGEIQTEANKIVSGTTHLDHNGPRFLAASGTTNEATILAGGGNADLVVVIANQQMTITADIVVSGLTLAAGSNNTALVDNSVINNQALTKVLGEHRLTLDNQFNDPFIDFDTVGSAFAPFHRKYVGLLLDNGSEEELMFGLWDDTFDRIEHPLRGFGQDAAGNDSLRITFANNDPVTLFQPNWIFLDIDGETAFSTPIIPLYQGDDPDSPATNQYWYDLGTQEWKRYNGSSWDVVERILLGVAFCDDTACQYVSCEAFWHKPSDALSMQICKFDADTAGTYQTYSHVAVMGKLLQFLGERPTWDMDDHLDPDEVESSDTLYYFYVTDDGKRRISSVQPRKYNMYLGEYHPHKPWRAVGYGYNDGSSDFEGCSDFQACDRIRLNTPNGRGSTNVHRLRFSTLAYRNGASFGYADSSTLGGKVTIRRSGLFSLNFGCYRDGAFDTFMAIAKDAAAGTVFPDGGSGLSPNSNDILACSMFLGASGNDYHIYGSLAAEVYLYQGTNIYALYANTSSNPATAYATLNLEKVRDYNIFETPPF